MDLSLKVGSQIDRHILSLTTNLSNMFLNMEHNMVPLPWLSLLAFM